MRHQGQKGGQVGELESHESVLQETIETVVVVVTIATERRSSYNDGKKQNWQVVDYFKGRRQFFFYIAMNCFISVVFNFFLDLEPILTSQIFADIKNGDFFLLLKFICVSSRVL